jgi:hypothetical protein
VSLTARKSQTQRILWLLDAAWPNWTPAPQLSKISLQYGARIFALRKKGWLIQNRVRIVNGIKHGEFRLGPRPTPSSAELRRSAEPSTTVAAVNGLLFGDLSPDRSYQE